MKIRHQARLGILALAIGGLAAPIAASASNCGMRPGTAGYAPTYGRYGPPMMPMQRGYGGYMPRPGYMPRQPMRPTYSNQMAAAPMQSSATSPNNARSDTAEAAIGIAQMRFDPPSLKISAGDTVTWTQNDGMPHAIGSGDGSFDSPTLYRGSQFSHTFDQPGTYDYICSLHPSMQGQIIVE